MFRFLRLGLSSETAEQVQCVSNPICPPGFAFTVLELMVMISVIAVLSLMAVPSYQEKIVREQIIEALPLADIAKAPVAASWAPGQPFPGSNDAAGLPPADKIVSNLVSSVQ